MAENRRPPPPPDSFAAQKLVLQGRGATVIEPAHAQPPSSPVPPTSGTLVVALGDEGQSDAVEPPAITGAPSGPPAPPSHIVTVRPRAVSELPPQLPPARRKVRLNLFDDYVGPLDEKHQWVRSPDRLGMPIVAGGQLIAAFAAAKIHSFAQDDDGTMVVSMESAFAPFTDDKTIQIDGRDVPLARAWKHKFAVQDGGALKRAFEGAIITLLERVECLEVHLVFRFVGGPPMDERSAIANGYQFWPIPPSRNDGAELISVRAPTRVEIDRRLPDARHELEDEVYLATELTWSAWLGSFFWRWTDPEKYELYKDGKERAGAAEKEESNIVMRKGSTDDLGSTLTVVAGDISRMVMSMASTLFASDPAMHAELERRGRGMDGTRIERGGTHVTYSDHFEQRRPPKSQK